MMRDILEKIRYSARNGSTNITGSIVDLGHYKWKEANNQGNFQFKEITNTSKLLILFDPSRRLHLKIVGERILIAFPGDTYSKYGNVLTETRGLSDGSTVSTLYAPDQTLPSRPAGNDVFHANNQGNSTFDFTSGFNQALITGFTSTGPHHDTIEVASSDFSNIADVLRNTHGSGDGVMITEPTSGDSITIAGVSKADLTHNRRDFALI